MLELYFKYIKYFQHHSKAMFILRFDLNHFYSVSLHSCVPHFSESLIYFISTLATVKSSFPPQMRAVCKQNYPCIKSNFSFIYLQRALGRNTLFEIKSLGKISHEVFTGPQTAGFIVNVLEHRSNLKKRYRGICWDWKPRLFYILK